MEAIYQDGIDAPFPEGVKLAEKKLIKQFREAMFGKGNIFYSNVVKVCPNAVITVDEGKFLEYKGNGGEYDVRNMTERWFTKPSKQNYTAQLGLCFEKAAADSDLAEALAEITEIHITFAFPEEKFKGGSCKKDPGRNTCPPTVDGSKITITVNVHIGHTGQGTGNDEKQEFCDRLMEQF